MWPWKKETNDKYKEEISRLQTQLYECRLILKDFAKHSGIELTIANASTVGRAVSMATEASSLSEDFNWPLDR